MVIAVIFLISFHGLMGSGRFLIRAPALAGGTVSPGIKNSTGQAEEKPLKRRFSQREGEQNGFRALHGKKIIRVYPNSLMGGRGGCGMGEMQGAGLGRMRDGGGCCQDSGCDLRCTWVLGSTTWKGAGSGEGS